jgi:hypothetical protein
MVEIEQLEGGAFRVSRVFPNAASMQAAASALERIVPEAFVPVHGYARTAHVGDRLPDAPEQGYPQGVQPLPIELRD